LGNPSKGEKALNKLGRGTGGAYLGKVRGERGIGLGKRYKKGLGERELGVRGIDY